MFSKKTARNERFWAGELSGRVMSRAAECYQSETGGPEARITVSYRLRVEDETARLTDIVLEETDLSARALEDCIVDALEEYRFAAPGIDDLDRRAKDSVSVTDLAKRARLARRRAEAEALEEPATAEPTPGPPRSR